MRADWPLFVQGLNGMFGDPYISFSAARLIKQLYMPENGRVSKYILTFMKYAYDTGWNNSALCTQFYDNIAERIKDQFTTHGRPERFDQLRLKAIEYDHRYWEREFEKRFTRRINPRPDNPRSRQPNPPNSSVNPPTNKSRDNSDTPKKKTTGPDGRLTEEERTRRINENLCLNCGKPGHIARACPSNTRQGRLTFSYQETPESDTEPEDEETQDNQEDDEGDPDDEDVDNNPEND